MPDGANRLARNPTAGRRSTLQSQPRYPIHSLGKVSWRPHSRFAACNTPHVPQVYGFSKPNLEGIEGVLLVEKLAATPLSMTKAEDRAAYRAQLRRIGSGLRTFHRLPLGSRAITFDGKAWPDWPAFVSAAFTEYFSDIAELGGSVPADLQVRVLNMLDSITPTLPNERFGAVHGDLSEDNVMLDGENRCYFVDFELAQWGDPMWDIAIGQMFLLGSDRDSLDAFLSGYGKAFSTEEVLRVNLYLVLRVLRLMRGKLWIYRDRRGFDKHLAELMVLLGDWEKDERRLLFYTDCLDGRQG